MLTPEAVERFSRQLIVKEIGVRGLVRLRNSGVAIIGCGATGSAEAELLARLGVGFIRVVDKDFVDLSNLPRVHLMYTEDAEKALPKAVVCAERVKAIDPDIEVDPVVARVGPHNILDLVGDVDLVMDGTDNMDVRYLINDAAVRLGKPWIFVGAETWYGNVLLVEPGRGPCLRCFMPRPAAERRGACDILGVVNTAVAMTASVAVTLALHRLLGMEADHDHLYVVDALRLELDKVRVKRNERCPACSLHRYEFLERRVEERSARICGTNAVEVTPPQPLRLDLPALARRLDSARLVSVTEHTLKIAVSDTASLVLFRDGRAIVDGIVDEDEAWRIYEDLVLSKVRGGV